LLNTSAAHIDNATAMTAKHRLVKFQEMSLSKGQMAIEGKSLRKGKGF